MNAFYTLDVKSKSDIIRANKVFVIENLKFAENLSLQELINAEVSMGVSRLNASNNSKELDKTKKGSWEWTYNSSARNLVRMWWLTKFCSHLFDLLLNSPEIPLSTCCQTAYKDQFGPHHPWIIRKGAGLAMKAAGTRD